MIRWRMSGVTIGGSGSEISSMAMVSFIPEVSSVGQRLGVAHRMQQRVLDGRVDVLDARQRVGRIHDAGAQRELLHAEALALVDEERWRPLVHLQHESWSWHESVSYSWGAKATLNVPSEPADIAWSTASRHRSRGYVAPTI